MKLGLTTTSRSVPPPAPSPQAVTTPLRTREEVAPTLRPAPLPAMQHEAIDEPPRSPLLPAHPHTQEGGAKPPQSAVRRKATAPRSESSLPAPRKKKERTLVETKRRILDAAAAEFSAKGFDGAHLKTIARAAGVQQARIHRYFADKEALHAEVLGGGLATVTKEAWQLLARMDAPVAHRKSKKLRGRTDIRLLAKGFVDLVSSFFTNRTVLSILRHEARRDAEGRAATKIVADNVAPLFDAIVARLDEMRARGEVRKDFDARHLVLSSVAMIAFPFFQESFVASIWPLDWHHADHLAKQKAHVVEMLLARLLP